jgi:hypothetical protein
MGDEGKEREGMGMGKGNICEAGGRRPREIGSARLSMVFT